MLAITAMEAYEPIEGMIAVNFKTPALHYETVNKISEAEDVIAAVHAKLTNDGISHVIYVSSLGRKPRGFDKIKNNLKREYINNSIK